MAEPPEMPQPEADLPPQLKWLKGLVTVLTLTMIVGVITITTLLVIRLGQDTASGLLVPGDYALPEGVTALGFSVVRGQMIVVGDDGQAHVFDAETYDRLRSVPLLGE